MEASIQIGGPQDEILCFGEFANNWISVFHTAILVTSAMTLMTIGVIRKKIHRIEQATAALLPFAAK